MKPEDLKVLSNAEIPESIRAVLAEHFLTARDKELQRSIELRRLEADRRKFIWNTPIIAALAGLITLSATFLFDRLSDHDQTQNVITLEQMRQELHNSEARLKQQLEQESAETVAKIEAKAREREFQYEIVRAELADRSKDKSDRADTLLFLSRAGILSELNQDELKKMAREQQDNPQRNIIPQLSSDTRSEGANNLPIGRVVFVSTANEPIEEIRHRHKDERGWSDIGYHFIVRLDGRVEVGRPIDQIPAIARGYNVGTVGIAVACMNKQNYTESSPCEIGDDVVDATVQFLKPILEKYTIGIESIYDRDLSSGIFGSNRIPTLGDFVDRVRSKLANLRKLE